MDWVQDANKNNVLSVEDGLGQINGAKDEADKIGRMQTDSKEMAMQVLDASKETEQFAHKLGDTSERLKELVASLREQTGQVVEQGKSQRKVTEEVENAFLGVSRLRDNLWRLRGQRFHRSKGISGVKHGNAREGAGMLWFRVDYMVT